MKTLIAAILFLAVPHVAGASSWWADVVVHYDPGPGQWVNDPQFNDPSRALGRPYGKGYYEADNSSLVTLGDGGHIILSFSQPIVDDPRNPHGFDFIVFSNCIFVGGNPECRWQELAFVEISQDGEEWFLIPPNILPADLVGGVDTGQSCTLVRNYAEYTPTMALPANRLPEEFYTIPDRQSYQDDPESLWVDKISGGGDAFDIAQAVRQSSPGVPLYDNGEMVPAGIDWFKYIKITDAVEGDSAGALGEISAEIGAVARVRPVSTIGEARAMADGTFVLLEGVVSAVFDGFFYLQQEDRSAGMRVETNSSVTRGNKVMLTGHLSTENGERRVGNTLLTVL